MKPHRFLSSTFLLLFAVGLAAAAPLPKQSAQGVLPPPTKKPVMPQFIAIDGHALAMNRVHAVTPIYPLRAKKAGIQGTVILEALIGKDGKVKKLRYVSGPSRLVKATVEAVCQWRYKPILLNGKPLEVDSEISVTYAPGKSVQTTPDPKTLLCPSGRFLPPPYRQWLPKGSANKPGCVFQGSA